MTPPDESLRAALSSAPAIDETIHPDDFMWNATDADHYWRGARSALRVIRSALLCLDRPDPARILDLPSGFGRVTRYLHAQWPEAEVLACDLIEDAVAFCQRQFGSTPVSSAEDPSTVRLDRPVDLIWVGSLLTHLPALRWADWMAFFERVTEPGALLIFSTHGRFVEGAMRGGRAYSLDAEGLNRVLADADATGFGYADYPDQPGYGVSLSRADWVVRELLARGAWRLDSYQERGLNQHQDVVTATRL